MNKFIRDLLRGIRGLCSRNQLRRNTSYALRQCRQNPVFTLAAVLILALGIGANTAIFSMFDQTLWRTLPVPEPDRIVNLSTPGDDINWNSHMMTWEGSWNEAFSYPMFRDLEKAQIVFTGIAAHHLFQANLSARGEASSSQGLLVSGSYFPVLGVRAALGRLLGPEDDRIINESPVVVLSYDYWQTRFGGDPNVLNQTLIVNGHTMTVVGVAQPGFDGTTIAAKSRVFVPITMIRFMMPDSEELDGRWCEWIYLFARLKSGITPEQAQASLNVQYHAFINEVEAPLKKGMDAQTMARSKLKRSP